MMSPLLALVLAATPDPAWMKLSKPQLDGALAALEAKPFAQRFVDATGRFKGTPYATSPLGEGQGRDPDPLIRYDAVDCLTFVETAMAISLAPKPDEVLPTLTRIRYQAQPVYEDRNHLMEAQWIPNNIAKGFITDVTEKYGGADAVPVDKTYTDETWSSTSGTGLAIPKDHQAHGTYRWTMLPFAKLAAKEKAIPSGTILVVVRQDKPDMITRISHVGLVVHAGRKTFVRHASIGEKEVVDEPLDAFLARNAKFQKWPVVGFGLYALNAPAQPGLTP